VNVELKGKVAIVTGGTKGIGAAIARKFIACGAKVMACGNEPDEVDSSGNLRTSIFNVASDAEMKRLVEETRDAFGGVDILVNSAGIQRYGTVVDTPEETWDEVLSVNLKGVFLASKYAIPEIAKRGGGAVINIASVQAFASQRNVAAYTASKGAIVALTRAMALDHADQNIRVNVICPASVDTPMLRWAADKWKGHKTAEETLGLWGSAHPVGRLGRPDEIAAAAAFLAADLCPFMTGADLKIDGGVLSKLAILFPE
jgi:NAD(P)-dependent dehydrogenase (short-subunit alcohol dehydrogenase family)